MTFAKRSLLLLVAAFLSLAALADGSWRELDPDVVSINGDRRIDGATHYYTYTEGERQRAAYGRQRADGTIERLSGKPTGSSTRPKPAPVPEPETVRPTPRPSDDSEESRPRSTRPRNSPYEPTPERSSVPRPPEKDENYPASKRGKWLSYNEAKDAWEAEKDPSIGLFIYIKTDRCTDCARWETLLEDPDIAALLKNFYLTKINESYNPPLAAVLYNDAKRRGWILEKEADPPTLFIYQAGGDSRIELGMPSKDNLERFLNNEILLRGRHNHLNNDYRRNFGTRLGESGYTRVKPAEPKAETDSEETSPTQPARTTREERKSDASTDYGSDKPKRRPESREESEKPTTKPRAEVEDRFGESEE